MNNKLGNYQALISIKKALDYIFMKQQQNGSWTDFRLVVGESNEWVTGFIGFNVARALKFLGADPNENESIMKAHIFIKNSFRDGWGYSEKIITDADSTANVSLFLTSLNDYSYKEQIIRFIKAHKMEDGGYCTYRYKSINENHGLFLNEKRSSQDFLKSKSFEGWCSSHYTVTCNCLNALKEYKYLIEEENIRYLSNVIENDISDYWWKDKNYLRMLLVQCLSDCSQKRSVIKHILNEFKDENAFMRNRLNAFNSAAGLASLLSVDDCQDYADVISIGIMNLIKLQNANGSWMPSAYMQVPERNITYDKLSNNTEQITYAEDINSLFTTSLCLYTIAKYVRIFG
ncbi:hypothetical protein EHE19_015030 [Ruminiclostridium herbifermentans]|uniref:Squalene cyclase C-terminal domain-containing protein n=1 Tax=Ruminiclostridium herbifermentans TaxID=2488810 RepID=A0A4U7JHK5_9FIRM|nr:prenyltransferase/squalene oxidase repeat-containing protein [Ruminiclostridium herbifermentans]QNU66180.1 hypothetical protein EHE19_015030 [Ruminiclostridium herbifermentans]